MTSESDRLPDAALHLESISKAFGGLMAVNDVSITVPRGLRGAVIGPNGAGKTTLFRIISGQVIPTEGRTMIFGRDVTKWPPHRRARIGLGRTYQVTNVFSNLNVEQNVILAAQALTPRRYRAWAPLRVKGEVADSVRSALEKARLANLRSLRASDLSHGQQKQLELAMALASNPQLLLLDEPAAGLTSAERDLISELVLALPGEITVLLIEHDLDLAFGLSERIICMNNGQIIADGTPEEIRQDDRVQSIYMGAG